MNEPAQSERLSVRTKLLFGCGQAVESGVGFAASTFLLYYLTNICRIPAATAGTLIFVSLLIDAVADPAIGALSDRWRSRWGRRLPFMAVGLPVLVAGALGVFVAPPLSGLALMAGVLAFNLMLRLGCSLFAMPYSALTAELTTDYNERSSIAVYRCIFAFLGTVAIIAPAFGLIFAKPEAMSSAQAYRELGWLIALVVTLFGGACIAGLLRQGQARASQPLGLHQSALADLRDVLRNRSFVLLFAASIACLVGAGSVNALNLYAYRDFWQLSPAQMQWPQLAIQVGLVLGIPVAALSLQRFEKHKALMVGIALITAFQGLAPLLVLAQAPAPVLITALCSASLVFGVCGSLIFVAFQAMVADAIDEHQLQFGTRCEGLYYSALVFGGKAAAGLGSMLAGFALSLIGSDAANGAAAATIRPDAVTQLGMIWGPGHALVFAVAVLLLMAYRLDKQRHAQIRQALASNAQRAAGAAVQ